MVARGTRQAAPDARSTAQPCGPHGRLIAGMPPRQRLAMPPSGMVAVRRPEGLYPLRRFIRELRLGYVVGATASDPPSDVTVQRTVAFLDRTAEDGILHEVEGGVD